jgi:excisionase family DNA binding protein
MRKPGSADAAKGAAKIREAELVDRIKRELREDLSQSGMTIFGIGHNRGPPFEPESPALPLSGAVKLALSVPEAGKLLGLSRNGSYEAAARGELPTVRIGSRIFVPRRALDELLNSAGDAWRIRQRAERSNNDAA